MEHSKNYEKVKTYYDRGMWSIERVRSAVGKWITEEEYEEITGEAYDKTFDALKQFERQNMAEIGVNDG